MGKNPKASERWRLADEIGNLLKVPNGLVWRKLKQFDSNLIERIKGGDKEAVIEAKQILYPKEERENVDTITVAAATRLMLWAFDKIGEPDLIHRAYKIACQTLENGDAASGIQGMGKEQGRCDNLGSMP